jgi:hypothetical protein
MKITKSQLKQIIEEELEVFLDEGIMDRIRKGFDKHARSGFLGTGPTSKELQGASKIGRRLTRRGSAQQKAKKFAAHLLEREYNKLKSLWREDERELGPLRTYVAKQIEKQEQDVLESFVTSVIVNRLRKDAEDQPAAPEPEPEGEDK